MCAAVDSPAQTFTSLANFNGANGAKPQYMSLVQGTDGNFYGTTGYGGASGLGTIFKISLGGTLTTLYSFAGADGANPYAGVIQATDGDFYGTTYGGGANGQGTVFKITLSGILTMLHSFGGSDGGAPSCALIQAANGNFYGTTREGGAYFAGTVFEMTRAGKLTTLYSFGSDNGDGNHPYAGLVQATNGNFYGTAYNGGANTYGTIFEITSTGTQKTLYSFAGPDGAYPYAALIQATDGDFYGTTYGGTRASGDGTVFRFTPGGALTTLRSFDGQDGKEPVANLVQATNGKFYGTTEQGGVPEAGQYSGIVFGITPAGASALLIRFETHNGGYPLGGLLQGTDGNLYGTTTGGGSDTDGTVFSVSLGVGPFVRTLPASGNAGTAVTILGTDLTGTTSVTFNGTPAAITFVSPSEISTTVPAGASTGMVSVIVAGITLVSNVAFRVTN
jgi:uncharacterized repeat protein (TIGR03803 family)